ncbi:seven tm domain protein [Entamoeba histolytica]|uniref:Seven tm domain protein n=1 Tax=Entamoeba histolytica TaxID=5759 RepID=A0A175JJ91_ENTHI|nr:seven tm domain protein [Entamoeba histolytica]
MTEVVRPFALPCITFKNFCPSLHFKRTVRRENVPHCDENPILADKSFVNSHLKDCEMSKLNQRRMKIESDNEKIKEPPVECEIHF